VTHPLVPLADLPGVAPAVAAAREACTELRWHPGLRRLTAAARAETVVRAARASAALDGADIPLDRVRGLVAAEAIATPGSDAASTRADPVDDVVVRALRVTAAAAEIGTLLTTAPAQALARLHLAAAPSSADGDSSVVGRPRTSDLPPRELLDLGPAVPAPDLARRLDQLAALLVAPGPVSALVLAAVVHGEILALRPFPSSNGLVARAASRTLIVDGGLDPTGVAVPEVGLVARGSGPYVGAAAAYVSGTPEGMAAWLRYWADAVVVGAREGVLVADAVLAGRLPTA
jgi:hypothetical protein